MPLASLDDTLSYVLCGVQWVSVVCRSTVIGSHINRIYTESTDGESIIHVLLRGSQDETGEAAD